MNEPEKYVNEEGVEEIFSLLKDEFDSREDIPVTDNEIINIMETELFEEVAELYSNLPTYIGNGTTWTKIKG